MRVLTPDQETLILSIIVREFNLQYHTHITTDLLTQYVDTEDRHDGCIYLSSHGQDYTLKLRVYLEFIPANTRRIQGLKPFTFNIRQDYTVPYTHNQPTLYVGYLTIDEAMLSSIHPIASTSDLVEESFVGHRSYIITEDGDRLVHESGLPFVHEF